MKKILIVGISDTVGGIETLFKGLFGEKSDAFDISILTFSEEFAFEDLFKNNGYHIYHLQSRKSHPLTFWHIIKSFYKRNNDFDYIWVNTSSTSMYELQYYGKKLTKAKIITHSHGTQFESGSTKKEKIFYHLNKYLAKKNYNKVIKSTDLFFACSMAAGVSLFGEQNRNKIHVIKNGIDVKNFRFNNLYRETIRKEFDIDDSTTLVLCVGRLSYQKNPLRTLSIFSEYHKANRKSVLLYAGVGELESKIKSKIEDYKLSDSVKLIGLRSDVNALLSAADFLLMPSRFEGLPVTGIEAQASGLQCFMSTEITPEVKITDLVHFFSLTKADEEWAEFIIKNYKASNQRNIYADAVIKAGYDYKSALSDIEKILV